MRRVIESDVCIIGSGISAAMVAAKLADERRASVLVVEAGGRPVPFGERMKVRERFVAYGENPWVGDHLVDQTALGTVHGFSPDMEVGGLAMHWGAVTPRWSPEDFRVKSLYGVGDDWPLTYEELEPFYLEAERRVGVAGEPGPAALDPRSGPYPMPPLPLSYNLRLLKEWGEKAGIPFWSTPSAKNSVPFQGRAACQRCDTCDPVCPSGAKYSPDFTLDALERAGKVRVLTNTLVRRLVPQATSERISHAVASSPEHPEEPIELHARLFVVAGGFVWSPHLLLLSASERHPAGLANRAGNVGRWMNGHRAVNGYIRVPLRLYPGMNLQHSLISKRFMRPGPQDAYVRHDLRLWEASFHAEPRLRGEGGALLLGDELLADWRRRAVESTARVRGYYDVLPGRDSRLTLDGGTKNRWGDPLPRLAYQDHADSARLRGHAEAAVRGVFERLARAGGGSVVSVRAGDEQEHPGGGCRMGDDPATSVVDRHGRSHDHENLFVVGAPTCVTSGCTNGTLTFAALSLFAAREIATDLPGRGAAPARP